MTLITRNGIAENAGVIQRRNNTYIRLCGAKEFSGTVEKTWSVIEPDGQGVIVYVKSADPRKFLELLSESCFSGFQAHQFRESANGFASARFGFA